MKEFLGSGPILALHFADPKTAQCQGMRKWRGLRGWVAAGAKRLRNNGLGVLMLESLLKVSSKRNQGTQVGGRLRGRVEPINGRKRVCGERRQFPLDGCSFRWARKTFPTTS